MRDVKLKRDALLEVVKKNRDAHRQVFLDALEGFREKAIQVFEQALEDAKAGRLIRHTVTLVQPMDMTKEYDRVIAMLKMSVNDEVTLTADEFEAYVLDRWRWKQQFTTSNSLYAKNLVAGGDEAESGIDYEAAKGGGDDPSVA